MMEAPWQLILFDKSIKKKQKISLILNSLPEAPQRIALELGSSQGSLGYFFRQKKGFWVSVDEDMANLLEAKVLLKENLVQVESNHLPFRSEIFDLIICPDYLEHIENDQSCLQEIARILKPGGQVITVTPHTGPGLFLYRLRHFFGLRAEVYGHKREGYNWAELEARLRQAGLEPERRETTSRFFSETLEFFLNLIYVKVFVPPKKFNLRNGYIRPMNLQEFKASQTLFRLYSLIYPFFWLASKLDTLISFSPGYLLIVWARKMYK